jgi:hypothetical protein
LLILFGGVTDRLIPLFAVGAFLAFTLSQAGMVAHWRRTTKGVGALHNILINALGAVATGITVLVVVAAKFRDGAWVVVLLLPAALILMAWVHRHYELVTQELQAKEQRIVQKLQPPIVIVPMERWNVATQKALRFAMALSPEVQAVHVTCEGDDSILSEWQSAVEQPAREAGAAVPKLVTLCSPYRMVLKPLVEHVLQVEKENRHRTIAVVIALMVERHWYHYFLHNQRGAVLNALLLLRGERRINIISVPWYLQA